MWQTCRDQVNTMGWRCARLVLPVLAACALAPCAQAHGGPDIHEREWVVKLGLPIGGSFATNEVWSFVTGVEANCGMMGYSGFWAGGYGDALWSVSRDRVRLSVGPMLGWGPFGFDGGYLLAGDAQGLRHGFVARPFLTFGLVAMYYRYGRLFEEAQSLHDFGLLLELPIPSGVRIGPEPLPPVPVHVPPASGPSAVPR